MKNLTYPYYNTIILLKAETSMTNLHFELTYEKGNEIFGPDSEPQEIKRWNIRDRELAEAELKKYKCSYIHHINDTSITEYALEYCECDKDGTFLYGSDFQLAGEDYFIKG